MPLQASASSAELCEILERYRGPRSTYFVQPHAGSVSPSRQIPKTTFSVFVSVCMMEFRLCPTVETV
jgi:hypothetical protein